MLTSYDSLLADRRSKDLAVVFLEPRADAPRLVNFPSLGNGSGGMLMNLARDCLVFPNNLVTDGGVDVVKEIEETGGDTLLIYQDKPSIRYSVSRAKADHIRSRSMAFWTMWSPKA